MSILQPPKPAKLVIGLLMKDMSLFSAAAEELVRQFGPADMVSAWLPFGYTDYYEPEMGSPLLRRMLTFKSLIEQDELSRIKLTAVDLEMKFSEKGRRRINIDPGYMLAERFVLATGKNYTHRIYIGNRIYADLTLIFQKGEFQNLPWTYPDYADAPIRRHLMKIRSKYLWDLKHL